MIRQLWHDDFDPALPPMSEAARDWQRRARAYLAKKTCFDCGTVDADGTRGPDAPVSPQPVVVDVMIENHADRWYCVPCGHPIWAAHLDHLKRLSTRLDRLARWKLGLLEWQVPKVWIQLELFERRTDATT